MKPNGLNVLLFSSLFPNAQDPVLGVFVENRLRHLVADTDVAVHVVAPVPWFPFRSAIWGRYGRLAAVPGREIRSGIVVDHPRFLVIPKFGMALTPCFLFWAARRAVKSLLAQGIKIDVIDAHYLYPDGVAAAKLGKALGIPVVMTARGSDVTEIGRMAGPQRKILVAAQRAAHVITVSNSLRDELMEFGVPAEKVTTLRNGVDCGRFKPTLRDETRAAWGNPSKVVLFAGWLIDRKRVDIALDAVAELNDVTLVVAGEGPLELALKNQADRLGLGGRVRFLGKVAPDEMPAIYSGADVLILPSEREGWANVLLEAMACGTPVVSRAVAGALDLVTGPVAGALVEGDDPNNYAEAIEKVLSGTSSRAATRAYAEKFGWQEISMAQRDIFAKAVENAAS